MKKLFFLLVLVLNGLAGWGQNEMQIVWSNITDIDSYYEPITFVKDNSTIYIHFQNAILALDADRGIKKWRKSFLGYYVISRMDVRPDGIILEVGGYTPDTYNITTFFLKLDKESGNYSYLGPKTAFKRILSKSEGGYDMLNIGSNYGLGYYITNSNLTDWSDLKMPDHNIHAIIRISDREKIVLHTPVNDQNKRTVTRINEDKNVSTIVWSKLIDSKYINLFKDEKNNNNILLAGPSFAGPNLARMDVNGNILWQSDMGNLLLMLNNDRSLSFLNHNSMILFNYILNFNMIDMDNGEIKPMDSIDFTGGAFLNSTVSLMGEEFLALKKTDVNLRGEWENEITAYRYNDNGKLVDNFSTRNFPLIEKSQGIYYYSNNEIYLFTSTLFNQQLYKVKLTTNSPPPSTTCNSLSLSDGQLLGSFLGRAIYVRVINGCWFGAFSATGEPIHVDWVKGVAQTGAFATGVTPFSPELAASCFKSSLSECGMSMSLREPMLDAGGQGLAIHPNPVSGRVRVALPAGERIRAVRVHDGRGVEVLQSQGSELNVSGLPEGLYFLRVETQRGRYLSGRLLKSKNPAN